MREGFRKRIVGFEARDHPFPVFNDILGAALGQDLAALIHDRLQRDEHALNRVGFKVGQDVHRVRQLAQRFEGSPALEIHQHEVDQARIILHGHRADESQQQLGFARAGGAGDHAVDAIAAFFG